MDKAEKNYTYVDVTLSMIVQKSKVHREWHHAGTIGRSRHFKSVCESHHKKQDGVVNKTFVQMLEVLGYDIELIYVKKYGGK